MGESSDRKEDIPAVAAREAVGGGSQPAGELAFDFPEGYSDAPQTPPSPVGHAGHLGAADDAEELFASCFEADPAVPSIAANSAVATASGAGPAAAAESGTAVTDLAIVAFAPAVIEGATVAPDVTAGAVAPDAAEGAIVATSTEGAIVAPAAEGAIVAPAAEGAIVAPSAEGAIVAPAVAEDPEEYLERVHVQGIESARSGQSTCRVCERKIAVRTPRFVISSGNAKYVKYVHVGCLEGFQEINRLHKLRDLDRLKIPDSDLNDAAMAIYLTLQESVDP